MTQEGIQLQRRTGEVSKAPPAAPAPPPPSTPRPYTTLSPSDCKDSRLTLEGLAPVARRWWRLSPSPEF